MTFWTFHSCIFEDEPTTGCVEAWPQCFTVILMIFLQCVDRAELKAAEEGLYVIDWQYGADRLLGLELVLCCMRSLSKILQKMRLEWGFLDQSPLLYLWLSVSLTLFIALSLYLYLSKYFSQHLFAPLCLSSLSLSPAGQTAAELLLKRSIVRYGTAS